MAQRLTYSEFPEKVLGFSGLSIVDFYSDSCIPCKRMSPVLSALENQYPDNLNIVKVNVQYEDKLVEEYGIRSTPTFLFIKNGEVIERVSGARKKEELEQIIQSNL